MNRISLRFGALLFALLMLGAAVAVPAAGASPSATPVSSQSGSAEPPEAVAGLDQTVERNASVLLDATQSFSPDGEITAYDWTITSPSGGSVDPTCDSADCGLAHFRAPELGEYSVTVTVTDDAGQEATDTLYVTVVPRGDFGVELSGPANAAPGDHANLTATISPGASVVENVTWYRGDQVIGNQSVSELGGTFNHSALIVPNSTYRAVVADQWNQTVTDTWNASDGPGDWTPDSPGSGDYPRIDGPAVVTGSPDQKTEQGWEYDDLNYQVETSEHGTVEESMWVIDNGHMDDFNAQGEQVDLDLVHGVNVVSANLDLETKQLAEYAGHGGDEATALDRTNSSLSSEKVLNQPVVVDPAPEINNFKVYNSDGTVSYQFSTKDKYNPPDSMNFIIGDSQVIKEEPVNNEGETYMQTTVPEGEYGETTVTLEVTDGRETVTRTKNIQLPPDPAIVSNAVSVATEEVREYISSIV